MHCWSSWPRQHLSLGLAVLLEECHIFNSKISVLTPSWSSNKLVFSIAVKLKGKPLFSSLNVFLFNAVTGTLDFSPPRTSLGAQGTAKLEKVQYLATYTSDSFSSKSCGVFFNRLYGRGVFHTFIFPLPQWLSNVLAVRAPRALISPDDPDQPPLPMAQDPLSAQPHHGPGSPHQVTTNSEIQHMELHVLW